MPSGRNANMASRKPFDGVTTRGRRGEGGGGGFRGRNASSVVMKALAACLVMGLSGAQEPEEKDITLPSDYEVIHANIVMRHGQRSRLVKSTAMEFGDNDGVTLTPEGELQSYKVGAQLRERYAVPSANVSTTIPGVGLFYDADRVQIVSSGFDRTLESAAALALALFPPGQDDEDVGTATMLNNNHIIVPVHAADPQNDMVILASDKCPVYDDNWIEFYRTDAFVEKQTEAESWIEEVYRTFEGEKTGRTVPLCWDEVEALYTNKLELHAPYNLWDCASVHTAAQEDQPENLIDLATPPADYTDAKFGMFYLAELVNWVEDQKYQQSITGRMVGGLYVNEMYKRMQQVIERFNSGRVDTVGRFEGMHITVGHYPTLKGIAGALDLGGLEGIPSYASHLSFELLYNATARIAGDDPFAVRIMYQSGTNANNLEWLALSPIFDPDGSLGIDEDLASQRDGDTGIMSWIQWSYLMEVQRMGEPVYYVGGEQEWCLDCLATSPDTCLEIELRAMTQKWEEAVGETETALTAKDAVDDGVEGSHLAVLSIFGLILGIGLGICVRPCLDRRNRKGKGDSSVGGNRGLEAWGSSRNGNNGSFRLGAKSVPSRQVLGSANGGRGGSTMQAVPTTDDLDDSGRMNGDSAYDVASVEDEEAGSTIPAFAPTSALGEPVPFPHKRQPSAMVGLGVDSSVMSGIDVEEEDGDPNGGNSPMVVAGGDDDDRALPSEAATGATGQPTTATI